MIQQVTRGRSPWVFAGLIAWNLSLTAMAQPASPRWKLTLGSTGAKTGETPIVVPIREKISPGIYRIKGTGSTAQLADLVQVFQDGGITYLAADLAEGTSESTKSFELEPAMGVEGRGVVFIPRGTNVSIKLDGQLFTEYRTDEGPKPFLYPLIGPTGDAFTRAYPMKVVEGETKDHPHHRSLWFTYGRLNGIDFWSEPKGKPFGSIKETSRKPLVQGPVVGRLHTTDDWISPQGSKVCEDERILTIYHTRSARILDFDITIKATEGPVEFSDTKEGMFGVRVASTMDVTKKLGGKIINSEGLVDDKAWGKPASWVDYTGPVEGKTVGIAILNHPSSFRYPTTWHVRTYGLFAANPFGWHDFGKGESGTYTLPKGKDIQFRYRVILHSGDTASANIPQAFRAYTELPSVSLSAE